ncbi:GNAT family N-acetyltransferase [Microlunatus antarcticus]|uniref:GNAT superfamily N-acetyltransferase n=1 Tax=Microlunatus antarcticus TaxID=53388 RepID=A0A7W5P7J5_9ACTN|nr:GNAT superfamily N-acetyltransferase [Microlunatus antarcticus]
MRTPGPADLEALGRCHLECWREAYGDLVDPARLAPFLGDVDEFVGRWRRALLTGAGHVRVADDGGELVGFSSVLPADGEVPAHLQSLYVRRSHWSTGLGQRLLDAVLGDAPATLEVLRDNVRARRFYARNGFVPDGIETEEPRLGAIEIGMVRPAPAG